MLQVDGLVHAFAQLTGDALGGGVVELLGDDGFDVDLAALLGDQAREGGAHARQRGEAAFAAEHLDELVEGVGGLAFEGALDEVAALGVGDHGAGDQLAQVGVAVEQLAQACDLFGEAVDIVVLLGQAQQGFGVDAGDGVGLFSGHSGSPKFEVRGAKCGAASRTVLRGI